MTRMYVTRHTRVGSNLLQELWRLYEHAYARTAQRAVSREQLYREEFEAAVADGSNRVWVVWADDKPVAMALIATDVSATRYLSRAYLQHNFPDRFERGEIHYILWTVVDREYAAKGAIVRLARGALALEAEEGALVIFDAPQANQEEEEGGLAELALRLGRMVGTAELRPLEVQRYYALDFAGSIEDGAANEDSEKLADLAAAMVFGGDEAVRS
jgi:Acetyltransferase (GNAT) domain